jgi:Na+-driven multidrug efflux pump
MELPGASYFYALAALSMAFVGFTSIVVVLHQGTGKPLSPFHILLTSLFVELGLMATGFAMLAPTLAICGMRLNLVWQISSAMMLAVLVPWLVLYPMRRIKAAPRSKTAFSMIHHDNSGHGCRHCPLLERSWIGD